ncbi:hypothetical protein TNCV_4213531 [Trichonephila clavipes]|nr:hypothetical protein TNCV_4213531 [Trichonephila clavipes]
MDRAAQSRTIAQQIQSVRISRCPLVPFSTICRRLECLANHPLLLLPLTRTIKLSRSQWCLLTNPASAATSRSSDSNLDTPRLEAAEFLYYISPHWSYTQYHDWIASLACLFSRSITNSKCEVHACPTPSPAYTTHCSTRSTWALFGSHMDCCTPMIQTKPL